MAERISGFVSHAGGLMSVEDARLVIGALMGPGTGAVLSKSGIRPAAGNPGQVTATGTADANVHVAPFQVIIQSSRATAGGVYVATLDAAKTINILSTPADATNPRNDLIIAQQSDEFYGDGANTFLVRQVVGTPAASPSDPVVTGSPDYIKLGRVRVDANATTIVTGKITDLRSPSASVGAYAVALGGILPVETKAVRDGLTKYAGLTVCRLDLNYCLEVTDGTNWSGPTRAHNVQKFTASGTWTKPDGAKTVVIEVVGGGGAGGSSSNASASQHSNGAGGGGGAYSKKTVDASTLAATVTVTIGAGGTPAVGTTGGTGGTTSFGTVQAGGGSGGTARGNEATSFGQPGGAGGTASAGSPDLVVPGQPGGMCWGETSLCLGGAGGGSFLGGGAAGLGSGSAGASNAGNAGNLYGGGGGGAQSNSTGAGQLGGVGAAGVCIVTTMF